MSEEHIHEYKEFFYFDEAAHKTIQSWRCVCGKSKEVKIHH